MPVTRSYVPILSHFFWAVDKQINASDEQQQLISQPQSQSQPQTTSDTTRLAMSSADTRSARSSGLQDDAQPSDNTDTSPKQLPKGVVLGKDGKPCRSCTSFASWAAMTKADGSSKPHSNTSTSPKSTPPTSIATTDSLPSHCPPDVEALGRSSWTLLHSMAATYPEAPSRTAINQTRSFLSLFGNLYPCGHCAEDFRSWMSQPGNSPRLDNREDFGLWACAAHNAVNKKLGKDIFDCKLWRERWVDGPSDGSCG